MGFPNATINGTPVNFTFQSASGIVIPEINGILLQNADYSKESKRVLVMDGNGNRATSAHTDPLQTAKLKWKISGSGLANAITNTVLQQPGNFITIMGCPSMPELVSANKYEVVGKPTVSGTNEDVKEISMDIEQAPLITGPAAQ